MAPAVTYDRIGSGYATLRNPDDRVAATLADLLTGAKSVINVGAGTGNYEPADRPVVAVEPSALMIRQRDLNAAPAIQATAEALPFATRSFDAAIALSTIHHWTSLVAGLGEMRRVAARCIVYFSEPTEEGQFWLTDDYFPEILGMETNLNAPRSEQVAEMLGGNARVLPFRVPRDFRDGAGAFWSRPEMYCKGAVQSSLSMFALLPGDVVARGTRKLQHDLKSGVWDDRHGHLRSAASMDLGYRFVVADALQRG